MFYYLLQKPQKKSTNKNPHITRMRKMFFRFWMVRSRKQTGRFEDGPEEPSEKIPEYDPSSAQSGKNMTCPKGSTEVPTFGVDPGKKSIHFLGISSYHRNPEPKSIEVQYSKTQGLYGSPEEAPKLGVGTPTGGVATGTRGRAALEGQGGSRVV